MCVLTCNAQDIGGVWQSSSPLSANYQACYDFYEEENSFEYRPGLYNGLCKVFAISGKYEIKQDSIYFTVTHIGERIGGSIRRRPTITNHKSEMEIYWISSEKWDYRPIPSTSNYWELTDYEVKSIWLENPETWSASFKHYKDKSGQEIIEIDGDKFYYIPGCEEFGTQEQ